MRSEIHIIIDEEAPGEYQMDVSFDGDAEAAFYGYVCGLRDIQRTIQAGTEEFLAFLVDAYRDTPDREIEGTTVVFDAGWMYGN